MTLDQIVERTRLPIRVAYDHWAGLWEVAHDEWGYDHGNWWGDSKSARECYLNMVSEMYRPGVCR